MKKKGIRVRRIGHRIKSIDNRDKRVELLQKLGSHSCFTKYPETNYLAVKPAEFPTLPNPVLEKDHSSDSLSIPYESMLSTEKHSFVIPHFESLIEVRKEAETKPNSEASSSEHSLDVISSANAEEAARVLDGLDESSSYRVNENGLKWWKQTGVEQRPDGVVCRWTMIREVTADGVVEWQDKYWEASDEFGFKELGSEKSRRDAAGNVWREFWRESMMQENGIVHMEKTADKWGKSGKGDECKRSGGSTTLLQKNQRNGLISGAS